MYKNEASQLILIYAHDTALDAGKTGDAANITAYLSKDGGAAAQTNDVNPTEVDSTNMEGWYAFIPIQAETNADLIGLQAKSDTTDVQIEGISIYTQERMRGTDNAATASDSTNVLDNVIFTREGLCSLIESQRGHHTGTGNRFYWNPINGNDANDGLTKGTARLTFASVHDNLITDSNHDIIYIVPDETAGATIITETITNTKRYVMLRGVGRDNIFRPTVTNADTITNTAEGFELSGVVVETASTGSRDAIVNTGDFMWLHNVWVDYSRGHGVLVKNASHCILEDFIVQDAAQGGSGMGVMIWGQSAATERNFIRDCKIIQNNGTGIHINGAYAVHNFIQGGDNGIVIEHNTGWGVLEDDGANDNHIVGPGIHFSDNSLGAVSLSGANSTQINHEQWAKDSNYNSARAAFLDNLDVLVSSRLASDSTNLSDITGAIEFLQKHVLNKLVVSSTEVKLYDDDGSLLKTWAWDASTQIRSKATP